MNQRAYYRNLDAQGRFLADFLPRDEYDEIVLSLGFGIYLHLQNERIWVEFQNAFKGADILDEHHADLAVRMTNGSVHVTIDEFGRITIPEKLRLLAALGSRIQVEPVGHLYYRVSACEK